MNTIFKSDIDKREALEKLKDILVETEERKRRLDIIIRALPPLSPAEFKFLGMVTLKEINDEIFKKAREVALKESKGRSFSSELLGHMSLQQMFSELELTVVRDLIAEMEAEAPGGH
jgi:hypothetical protein